MKHIKTFNEAIAFGDHSDKDYSDEMSYGQLERCMDYARMIRERIEAGQPLDPWMHSQIAVAENELNSVFDALDGDDGVVESERECDEILDEGTMSDIHQMAGEVKDDVEFTKRFFQEYGDRIKKTSDSISWVKSLYKDTVDESLTEAKLSKIFKAVKQGSYPMTIVVIEDGKVIHQERVITPSATPAAFNVMQTKYPKAVIRLEDNTGKILFTESLVTEEKAEGDRSPIDDDKIETALKKKEEETGVPIEFLRIIMRRGMAAWKSGHRPGATQQMWGYSRLNSFLTKQPGTWGGADADVAKEVRDGGHDKKLKKA
jgi:hypothetical protein